MIGAIDRTLDWIINLSPRAFLAVLAVPVAVFIMAGAMKAHLERDEAARAAAVAQALQDRLDAMEARIDALEHANGLDTSEP